MGNLAKAPFSRSHPLAPLPGPTGEGAIVQGELVASSAYAEIEGASVYSLLLADKRSLETRRAYEGDLKHFHLMTGADFGARPKDSDFSHDEMLSDLEAFLSWPPPRVAARLAIYKNAMIDVGLKESTINRRLAAVRSLFKFAFRLGRSQTDARGLVENEKVAAYINTRGFQLDVVKRLLKLPAEVHGADTVRALRDEGILRCGLELGLRRAEIHRLDVGDFSLANRELAILGKARGTQKEVKEISPKLANVLAGYLMVCGHGANRGAALFWNLTRDPGKRGRIGLKGVEEAVKFYEDKLGVETLLPHELRHTSINQACVKFKGNVPYIMAHSRHKDANTVLRYIRNAEGAQGKITLALSELFE